MMRRQTAEVRDFILEKIDAEEKHLTQAVVQRFGISRQAVSKNIRALIQEGLVVAEGLTRDRTYQLKCLFEINIPVTIKSRTEENQVWLQDVAPHLKDVKDNVREICHFGFTEMLNNVIDHSVSEKAEILLSRDAVRIRMSIRDYGIGIWNNLQKKFNLTDPRHALLELSKGKLTTDPKRHTGQGIFFTSRMFDEFFLESGTLSFCHFPDGDEWLFDIKEHEAVQGTLVIMNIHLHSTKTTKEVFDKFASDFDDFGFTRTHVALELVRYGNEQLISRSQAKRLLMRLEQFQSVYLDFKGISTIGQAFADEIFRVFQNEHPDIRLHPVNTTKEVDKMIARARHMVTEEEEQSELPLS
jgi:anti-sigma regulatory factor (Ser/Thr protein kinase)